MQCSSSRRVSQALLLPGCGSSQLHRSSRHLHLPRASPAVAGCLKKRAHTYNRYCLPTAEQQPVVGPESSGTDGRAAAPATAAEGEVACITVTGPDNLSVKFTLKEFLLVAEFFAAVNNLRNATGRLVFAGLHFAVLTALWFGVSEEWSNRATLATLKYLDITGTPNTLLYKGVGAAVVWWANWKWMQSCIDIERLKYSIAMDSMSNTPAQLSRLSKENNCRYLAAAEAEEYIKSKWNSGWATRQPALAWTAFTVVQLAVAWLAYALLAVGLAG